MLWFCSEIHFTGLQIIVIYARIPLNEYYLCYLDAHDWEFGDMLLEEEGAIIWVCNH